MRLTRTVSTIITAGLILCATATPALAAPPSNDTFGNATAITSLPFGALLDTRQATNDAIDEQARVACNSGETPASVWYSYTPTADEGLRLSTLGSSYPSGFAVVTGEPGGFTAENCGSTTLYLIVEAGITYHIMIYGGDGTAGGGDLSFAVNYQSAPPTITLVISPTASHNPRTGSATVSGTVTCAAASVAGLFTVLRQRIGPGEVSGITDGGQIICDGVTRPWSLTVKPQAGTKFIGGKATAVAYAFACGGFPTCKRKNVTQTVKLKRRR